MDSLHSAPNASQNSGIPSANSNNGRKRRKLKRMISSSDSDDDMIEVRTPTKSSSNEEKRGSERPNSNGSDAIRTPKTVKKQNVGRGQVSDGRDNSPEREKLSESRDEMRLKKEVLAKLNSLENFYTTSQELKTSIQQQLNTSLDQYIGCIKTTQSHGDLRKFSDLKMFKALKNYQQCGVHWLSVVHEVPYASAILADEMGLGKTAQVCVFLEYIYRIHGTSATPNTSSSSYNGTPSSRASGSEESKGSAASDELQSTSPMSTKSNVESNNSKALNASLNTALNASLNTALDTALNTALNAAMRAENEVTPISAYTNTNTNTEGSTPTTRRPGITIIIVPLSVMNNWLREFETWTNLGPKVVIFHGNYKERMELLESILERMYNSEIYVIIMTLGMFKEVKILKHFEPFEYLVIDEAHSIKNPNTAMYRKLLFSLEFRHKLLLTGESQLENEISYILTAYVLLQLLVHTAGTGTKYWYWYAMLVLVQSTPIQNTMDELCSLLQFAMPYSFESSKINQAIEKIISDTEYIYSIYENHALLDELLGKTAGATESGEKRKAVESENKGEEVVDTPLKIAEVDSSSTGQLGVSAMADSGIADSTNAITTTNSSSTTDSSTTTNAISTTSSSSTTNANTTSSSQGMAKSEQGTESQEAVGKIKNELYTCINDIIERNMNRMEISEHLKIIQKLTTPFILRRLKKNVMNELPKKNSVYVPCEMVGVQLEIYQRFFTSRTLNTVVLAGAASAEQSRVGDSDDGENSCADSDDTKYDMDNLENTLNSPDKEVMKPVKGSTTEKMTYKIFQLRRICNHPLLVRGLYYTEEQIEEIAKIVVKAQSVLASKDKNKGKEKDKGQGQSKGKQSDKNKSSQKEKSDEKKRNKEQELEKMKQYLLSLSDFEIYNVYLSNVGRSNTDSDLGSSEEQETEQGAKVDVKSEVKALEAPRKKKEVKMGSRSGSSTCSGGDSDVAKGGGSATRDHSDQSSSSSLSLSIGNQWEKNEYLIEEHLFFESAKINKMFDLLTLILSRNENALIFSQFTSYLDIIEKCFELRGIFNYLRLDGSLNVKQKEEILKLFSSTSRGSKEDAGLKKKALGSEYMATGSEDKALRSEKATGSEGEALESEEKALISEKSTRTEQVTKSEEVAVLHGSTGASESLTKEEATVTEALGISTSRSTESTSRARTRVDTGYRIMLISTKVGGIGLNLTKANNVILMDQSWNPHNDLQAEDRAHRIGQDKTVNIYKLFTKNTIEEHVIFKSTNKLYLNQLFNEA
ncbi:DEAD-box family helicase [Theileria orientalis strain Shintoku]|uniref:DEAD-box family helicase n=1 Tax=Theileria orientalis strain Shintoku TaxID=869250 RepID=J7M4R5_THEOR|nr:DEAD-box family helicase [Theileria orientalis strain Shintoku]BAM42440.1 DEAD-box family helicase [Theileria orientalis strain Shintoku]|eukprot:XP_009692741.1 DEAD-box family helicase [Theileria orientalis strain Shintoku]